MVEGAFHLSCDDPAVYQQIVAEYEKESLCAALAKSESLLWIYSMEHTNTAFETAMSCYMKLEEITIDMNEACKPPSVLSSIVCSVLSFIVKYLCRMMSCREVSLVQQRKSARKSKPV